MMIQRAQEILNQTFGYHEFRENQKEVIEHVINKKDGFVLMPTGGGKSLCFQIPALLFEGVTIVVSPLISLMKDQVQALRANGVNAAYINSSLDSIEEIAIMHEAAENKLKLLYLSPEKLLSIAENQISKLNVSLIAIDEAHCISMWGHDFRPEYTKMKAIRKLFSHVPFMALTATADKITRGDIINQLALKECKTFISSFNRENLSIEVKRQVPKKEKTQQIVNFITKRRNESGIIYCLSRKNTEELANTLNSHGIRAGFYHAGMNSEDRAITQEQFINDDLKIIVATIAFGMGIDKSNVRWIIHNNLPKNIEGYYQEIGRAGRDGLPSETILYYSYKDLILLRKFAEDSGQADMQIEKLKRIQQFVEATSCRRKILLAYFNEHLEKDCGNCDVCLNPPKFFDGTIIAQIALSAMYRLNQKVSANTLINVLRGSRNQEIISNKYDTIKTYGKGAKYSFFEWQNYIIQLVNVGVIEIDYQNANQLKITDFGLRVLKSESTINLTVAEKIDKTIATPRAKKSIVRQFDNMNKSLFDALKNLRQEIAKEERVPAYIVFSDKSLKEMASALPQTKEEFMQISGVGNQKLERFFEPFSKCIAENK